MRKRISYQLATLPKDQKKTLHVLSYPFDVTCILLFRFADQEMNDL